MIQRVFVLSALLALLAAPASAQPAPATPTFEIADVHASSDTKVPMMGGGFLHGDRFIIHHATVVDLIANAYSVDSDNILGGPGWLDTDRFDIVALATRATSPNNVKLMLRNLLAERFHLILHNGTHPLPCYVLRVDKGGPKLKPADEGEDPKIDEHHTPTDNPPGVPAYYSMTVRNMPMERFLYNLQHIVNSGYIGSKPLVDATDLKGGYDFELHWSGIPKPDGLSIFDAVQKQLGLRLALDDCPLPVLIVDSVDEKPTPNTPDIDKVLPPPPPLTFEVATLKPTPPGRDDNESYHTHGAEFSLRGFSVQLMILFSWEGVHIASPPKWLDQDRYDLVAKTPLNSVQAASAQSEGSIDWDDLRTMTRALLAERFHLQIHSEERPFEAYTLVADNPKVQRADPMLRSACVRGAGPDGKDPRIANPALDRAYYCHNMTMAKFGERLRMMTNNEIPHSVADSTGLKGGYNFSLSWTDGSARVFGGARVSGDAYGLQHPPPSGDTANPSPAGRDSTR